MYRFYYARLRFLSGKTKSFMSHSSRDPFGFRMCFTGLQKFDVYTSHVAFYSTSDTGNPALLYFESDGNSAKGFEGFPYNVCQRSYVGFSKYGKIDMFKECRDGKADRWLIRSQEDESADQYTYKEISETEAGDFILERLVDLYFGEVRQSTGLSKISGLSLEKVATEISLVDRDVAPIYEDQSDRSIFKVAQILIEEKIQENR